MKLLLAPLVAAMVAVPAAAQTDFRNLDHGRPTRVEDAYPLERYGFELSAGYEQTGTPAGRVHLLLPELMYGFGRGAHIGVRLPFAVPSRSTGNGGLAGIDAAVLVNLTTERVGLPGLAVRVDAALPAGAAAGQGSDVSLTALATRTLGAQRVHLNAALALHSPDAPGTAGRAPRWWIGLAVDHTMLRSSTLLIAEGSLLSESRGDPLRYGATVGVRRQLAPTVVANLGLGLELVRGHSAEPTVTLGFSHSFALAFLMPGGER